MERKQLYWGADTVIGFDASAPGAGGDVLEVNVDGAPLVTFDFAAAIAGGFLKFGSADGGNDTDIFLNLTGSGDGDDFALAGTLDGIAFESEFVSTALADNFDFVGPPAHRARTPARRAAPAILANCPRPPCGLNL